MHILQQLSVHYIYVCVNRVLVTAVNAENTDLSLVFFNNCFDDDYSKGWFASEGWFAAMREGWFAAMGSWFAAMGSWFAVMGSWFAAMGRFVCSCLSEGICVENSTPPTHALLCGDLSLARPYFLFLEGRMLCLGMIEQCELQLCKLQIR